MNTLTETSKNSPRKRTPPWLRDINAQRLEICQALIHVEAELYDFFDGQDSEDVVKAYEHAVISFDQMLGDPDTFQRMAANDICIREACAILALVDPVEYEWLRKRHFHEIEQIKASAQALPLTPIETGFLATKTIELREKRIERIARLYGSISRPAFAGAPMRPA